jgi:hypothetical protein
MLAVDRARPCHAPLLLALAWLVARRVPGLRALVWGALFHRTLDYTWHVAMVVRAAREGTLFGRRAK